MDKRADRTFKGKTSTVYLEEDENLLDILKKMFYKEGSLNLTTQTNHFTHMLNHLIYTFVKSHAVGCHDTPPAQFSFPVSVYFLKSAELTNAPKALPF